MHEIIDNRPFKVRIASKYHDIIQKIESKKEQKELIKHLKKEKKYDDIYVLFGQGAYLWYVSEKYMKADIKKLLKFGLFEDLYAKYGAAKYKKYIPKMQAIDIYMETGKKVKGLLSKFKYKLVHQYLTTFASTVVILSQAPMVILPIAMSEAILENARVYAEEISEYDRRVKEYGEEVRKLGLNDLQNIMKVMDDMWNYIGGYGEPTKDIGGFERLAFEKEGNMGVCRNMADDVTAKLNAINPEYNARNMIVYMEDNDYKFIDIKRKLSISSLTGENQETYVPDNSFLKHTGNHKVTLVDINEDDVTLVVDPTNPGIGIFNNGEIYMFSSVDGKGVNSPYLGQVLDGVNAQMNYYGTRFKSFFKNYDLEELREKYGIDAANNALEEVREISKQVSLKTSFSSSDSYTYDKALSLDAEELNIQNGRTR